MNEKKSKQIICLMGPTASGKTDLAVALSQHLPCDIISVDSAMIYRGMDIGTAKPSAEILQKFPHRLIDIRDPAESYSAADFCLDARREIDDIFKQARIPLLVGGTMLYFRALQQGLSALPSAEPKIRAQLNAIGEQQGWSFLHARLQQIDPLAAQRINPNDPQRLQRALEVYELTGKTLTELQGKQQAIPVDWKFINIGLMPEDRSQLQQRITERFDNMLTQGLFEEVEVLYKRSDLSLEKPALRAVGYRQVWEHLAGHYDKNTMREQAIIATRQLAKRQMTWLRSWPSMCYFEPMQNPLDHLLDHVLQHLLR